MKRSLRLRLMLGAATLAVLFIIALQQALQQAFSLALEDTIEQRLAADVSTLISAARVEDGRLYMPDHLPDEEFTLLDNKLFGFIYDRDGHLLWRSASTHDLNIDYLPRYDGDKNRELHRVRDANGVKLFVYDMEIDLLRGEDAAYSIVTVQPSRDYDAMLSGLRKQLYVWLGGGLLVLLVLLWLGLTWGFRTLRGMKEELDQVESGERERLSEDHPRELLRLTRSLNRLLDSERLQRERYRDSLADLAHGLKTPLSLLQAVGETLSSRQQNREQVEIMGNQIERMNQQIGFQLQRASLRRSGLIRHQVALAPLLDTLETALDKVHHGKQVTLERALPDHFTLPLEQGALLEVLGNLLENGYRLCLSRVRVSARRLSDGDILVVEDDGPGVAEDQRERILRRGERLDTRHPGQGLGLAVVKDILDSYSSTLTLDDSPLGGARFTLFFPR